MKIFLYCPNKPLEHPNPSGDLAIARSIRDSLAQCGHDCQEAVVFRSRWFWRSSKGWILALAALLRALRACFRHRPDLWLTYHGYYKSPDVIGPWIARLCRMPYICFQPMFATRRRKDPQTLWGYRLNRLALASCCHAFTNNLSDLEALKRIIGERRLTYLPPGIFPEEFSRVESASVDVRRRHGLPMDVPLLLSAARLRPGVKEASVRFLFDALVELRRLRDDWFLLFVGDGPREEELRAVAAEQLGGHVIFAGGLPRSTMPLYYSAADLFVFPGIRESLGMVYLEAQACGTPVVALASAGVSQVVEDGVTGTLVADHSPGAMAAAVEDLLANREKREAMGRAGIAFVHAHRNLHRNYHRLADHLSVLAAGNRRRRFP